jgi:uncharacterized Zn finger protein
MSDELLDLTQADIRARCSGDSFKRGQNYYTGGAITQRLRHGENSLEARVSGTDTYRVSVWVKADGDIGTHCNCPYDYGGDCKHIVATLLAWVNEPESFQPPVDLKAILNSRSKADLVNLLLDILAIYPGLVDDLEVITGPQDDKLEEKVADLFASMAPWGPLTEEQVEVHMQLMARRAERLADQGQVDLARRVYFALTLGCVNLYRNYGAADYFSPNIPYDFAEAYSQLAAEQVQEHGAKIKAEVEALYRDVFDPDALGLNEALTDIWCELMDRGLVD